MMKVSLYVTVMMMCGLGALTAPAQSSRPGWGATPYAGPGGTGVTFRTWAPNASSANVAGSFNGWSTLTLPLQFEGAGVWSRDVPGAQPGQPYKFIINGSNWRRDPYSRQIESSGTRNSIIVNPASFNWGTNSFVMPPPNELVIYEMHVGAFYDPVPGDGKVGQYSNVLHKLDHLIDLGINAIELMPISEFPTSTSWGYNLSYPFAVESSYGTPDQLKNLIKTCHERGIAVLMDVVNNHWGDDSDDWSLWQYDGWSTNGYGGIYFYSQPNVCCTWWGPRPDYSRPQVRDYILNNFRMWKQDYRIDGFRWDAPKFMLFTDDTQTIPVPDGSNVINYVINTISNEFPGTFNIAEDIKGVVGFDSHWDMNYQGTIQGIMSQGDDNSRNMNTLAGLINSDSKRIVYTESHDTTGDLNAWAVRFPKAVDGVDPESYYARKRSTLASLITLTSPGTPMIWQGQEMLETNLFSDARSLDWSRTNTFSYITKLYRDVIHLRRNLNGVSGGLSGSGCGVFLLNNSHKMIGYRRYDPDQPEQDVVVIANLRNQNRINYPVQFPEAGTWYVHVNTDSLDYGPDYEGVGSQQVIATGSPPMANVDVGRYSALILSKVPVAGMFVHGMAIVDQPYGDGDDIIEPGETIFASLSVSNRGQVAVSGVTAQLIAHQPGVSVSQPLTSFPDIMAGSIATGYSPCVFHVSTNWVCGQPIDIEIKINYAGNNSASFFSLPSGLAVESDIITNTYVSTDVPKAILDNQTSFSELVITNQNIGPIEKIVVRIRANHTWNSDVVLALQHPDGTEVLLSNRRGGSLDNFGTGTCEVNVVYAEFDAAAVTAISNGVPPFAGTFCPDGDLTAFHGKTPLGTWRLRATDLFSSDEGSVLCWGIQLAALHSTYGCETYTAEDPDVDGDNIPNWWEVAYYGNSTNAVPHLDTDEDGFSNWQEYLSGTDPVNPQSFLQVQASSAEGDSGVIIQWNSTMNQTYRLWRSAALMDETFTVVESNIPATPVLNSYLDGTATGGIWFYRVELE